MVASRLGGHRWRTILSLLRLPIALALTVALAAVPAGQAAPEVQREQFLEARKALRKHRLTRYRELAGQLRDYPLYPYLQYAELRTRLDTVSEQEITGFLTTYADLPLGPLLQRGWLYRQARQGRWELFLKHYQPPQPVELQCYALQARLHTGDREGIEEDILPLWLVGKSQPDPCDPLFEYLYDVDYISDDLVWQRIRLAMKNGRTSLAGYLARRLPDSEQQWVALWRQAHNSPSATLRNPRLEDDTPRTREIILHTLQRLARFDPVQAHEKWLAIESGYDFSAAERGALERYIALVAAQSHEPDAQDWLEALPPPVRDQHIREWQIRTAIRNRDWNAVLDHFRALPAAEQQADPWRYWRARALEQTGQRLPAMNEYAFLARERSYHGFLAADYLGWPYEMGYKSLDYDPPVLEALRRRPGLVRAHELYLAGMLSDARREWAHATRNMNDAELRLAAVLASQWGWNDRAILTVARTGDYADLKLRFPLEHEERVRHHAANSRLEPGHVFAVIRQESAFNREARSPAGARGLMQLMPATGRLTAQKNRISYHGTGQLYDIDKNLELGTSYLRQVMDRFGNNPVLASAAYNAGPHRVVRWLPESEPQSAASWIANIPYSETRQYVQRILAYAAIYDWRMEFPITRLDERMPPVLPESQYEHSRQ
jgi:soluble lytic murein transglycosylase